MRRRGIGPDWDLLPMALFCLAVAIAAVWLAYDPGTLIK